MSVTGVESRHRRRRSTSTGTVEQKLGHDPSSGSWNKPDYRRQATRGPPRHDRRATASDTEQRSRSIRDEYRACLNAQARRWRAAEADRLVSARVSAESKESSAGVPAIRVAYATLDSEHASQSIYLAVCVAELVL
jgi:hypothetical protein